MLMCRGNKFEKFLYLAPTSRVASGHAKYDYITANWSQQETFYSGGKDHENINF